MNRSRWFEGLLAGEQAVKDEGVDAAMLMFERSTFPEYTDEFDRGFGNAIQHYMKLERLENG